MNLENAIFNITSDHEFNEVAMEMFKYQYENNTLYYKFCKNLNKSPQNVSQLEEIPFLPIEFFKTSIIKTGDFIPLEVFQSSGTTGIETSKHYVKNLDLYSKSFRAAFNHFYGDIKDYIVLALLPSYMEQEGSSLIHMVEELIQATENSYSGFYLDNLDELAETLKTIKKVGKKGLLLGVSFALLDLAEKYELDLSHVIIMETGGMKGRRKELTRDELHDIYKSSFKVKEIHSEYGMTELLSQAYSDGGGVFSTPNWMKVLIRDVNDPMHIVKGAKTGGINVIDLANIHSCSFIATQDLGKQVGNGQFEVLGRFDHSDIRGCNLLIS